MEPYPSGTFVVFDQESSGFHISNDLLSKIYVVLHNHNFRHSRQLQLMPVFGPPSSKDFFLYKSYTSSLKDELLRILSIKNDDNFLGSLLALEETRLTIAFQENLIPLSEAHSRPSQWKTFLEKNPDFLSKQRPILFEMQHLFMSRYGNITLLPTSPTLTL